MKLGPKARNLLLRLAMEWEPGQHVLVSGGTGSGKTLLARYLDQIMLHKGERVVVLIGKIRADDTITSHYRASDGWVRWTTWPKTPPKSVKRVLFWPDVEGKTSDEAKTIQRREFKHALDSIFISGGWVVHIDEGLFMTDPEYMGLRSVIGMMFQMMRSAKGTLIMLVQRPSNIPLTVYTNVDYAAVSRAPNEEDVARLAELDTGMDKRALKRMINANGKHDFTFIRARFGIPPETLNLAK